jgi:mannose-1-phosphate guanylyltransferase
MTSKHDCGAPAGKAKPAFQDAVAVLMAGGAGTRFWPLSTPGLPKQFITALTDRPLYVQAAERARALVPWDRVLVMTHAGFVDLVRQQTPDVPPENVILEPLRRNTAPAVILAAVISEHRWPGATMVVMPSDHLIADTDAFRGTIECALARAGQGGLGAIGIPPTFPATGFGYLRLGGRPDGFRPVRVEQFVEKPDQARAEQYVASGEFLWNSGIFVWKAAALLEAASRHLPQVYQPLASLRDAVGTPAFAARAVEVFRHIESVSVDYGIMEKAEDVWAIPAAFSWSDMGSWAAAAELLPADAAGNHVRGDVALGRASGNVVIADAGRPVVVAGVSDCVVVQGPSGTLVCHKDMLDSLKALLERVPSAQTPGES